MPAVAFDNFQMLSLLPLQCGVCCKSYFFTTCHLVGVINNKRIEKEEEKEEIERGEEAREKEERKQRKTNTVWYHLYVELKKPKKKFF